MSHMYTLLCCYIKKFMKSVVDVKPKKKKDFEEKKNYDTPLMKQKHITLYDYVKYLVDSGFIDIYILHIYYTA